MSKVSATPVFILFLASACATEPPTDSGSPTNWMGGAGAPGDMDPAGVNPYAPPTQTEPGTGPGTDSGGQLPSEPVPGPALPGQEDPGQQGDPTEPMELFKAHIDHPVTDVVRFIAVGDTGTGDENQFKVAQAMTERCEQKGCDFVILLGDNIYDQGPIGIDDIQWQLKFEQPYATLNIPFYVVIGNHDTAAEPIFGSGYVPEHAALEVQYSEKSDKWTMPATHYTLSAGPVGFVMLDTTALYNHSTVHGDQHAWIDSARDEMTAKHSWVFATGHHTYVSNGEHGNAGTYAYFDFDPGQEIKDFFDTNLCGQIDMYLSGHDHTRQWIDASMCAGTEIVVSGAGAKTRDLTGSNPSHWESNKLGFFYVTADATTLTGQFIDENNEVDFERVVTK